MVTFQDLQRAKLDCEKALEKLLGTSIRSELLYYKYKNLYFKKQLEFQKLGRLYFQNETLLLEDVYVLYQKESEKLCVPSL